MRIGITVVVPDSGIKALFQIDDINSIGWDEQITVSGIKLFSHDRWYIPILRALLNEVLEPVTRTSYTYRAGYVHDKLAINIAQKNSSEQNCESR